MHLGRTLYSCLFILGAFCQTGRSIEIAKDGASKATIVVADGSSVPVNHAAKELQTFLKQMTRADIPIAGQADTQAARILVGPQAARLADPAFTTEGLGTDGMVVRTVGRDLILAGGEPRGTLYAVYSFLEDDLGCHWWTPTASVIPERPSLRLDDLNRRYVPPLDYREPYWETALNRDWAVRNKAFGPYLRLDEQTGGRPPISAASHSFYHLIPPKRYFKDHPEWFSGVKGKRISEGGQLCLSNEAMQQELTRNVLANLKRSKCPTQISVAQNDGGLPCDCAKCRAIDEEEGNRSGTIVRCVNVVAAEVAREFPNVVVSTFAYTYSEPAPKITRPRENVAIWLCTMNASYNLPLDKHKRNDGFVQDLRDWGKISKRIYIWDYTTNFRHYLFIHPNLRVLGPNIRFFVDNHVRGVFEQGSTGTVGAEFAELRAWVLAKLLWDPRLDDKQLISTFLNGYYGAGGPHIQSYIDLIHDVMQAAMQPLGCYEEPNRKFMNIDTLSKGWGHLKAAERAVAADPVVLQRVRLAQMPAMYAFMIRWADLRAAAVKQNVPWPMPEDPQQVLADFKARAASIGIKLASELETFDKLESKLKLPPP